MIDKGGRFMHITTHHIPAKRRHIDAATRLRRLSHVVAASTRVVRGCKLPPPPLTKRNTPNCFITALGSDRSGLRLQHATCAPLGPTAAERGFARAYGSTLEARRLWGFIASVLIQPRHPAVRAHVFPLMPSYAAPHSPCGRSTRHVPILRLSEVFAELPQASKWGKWPSRNFRERQNGGNGLCGTSANAPKGKMELAGLLQTSQRGKWSLQDFCKRPKGENGACRTSANAPKGKTELAELLQTPQRGKWSLQNFCKRLPIHSYITPHT